MKQPKGFFFLLEVDNRNVGVHFTFSKYCVGFNLWFIGFHFMRCPFFWYVDFLKQPELTEEKLEAVCRGEDSCRREVK